MGAVICAIVYFIIQLSTVAADDRKHAETNSDKSDKCDDSPSVLAEQILSGRTQLFVPGFRAGKAWTAGSFYQLSGRLQSDEKPPEKSLKQGKSNKKQTKAKRSSHKSEADGATTQAAVAIPTVLAWNLPASMQIGNDEIGSRGQISISRDGSLDLTDGWVQFPSSSAAVLQGLQQSRRFTIVAEVTCDNSEQSGPARILTCSRDTADRNFTLGQLADQFVFRVRSSSHDRNGTEFETQIPGIINGQKQTVAVSWCEGKLICAVDGRVVVTRSFDIDFSSWQRYPVFAGNETTADRPWKGHIHSLAIVPDVQSTIIKGLRPTP